MDWNRRQIELRLTPEMTPRSLSSLSTYAPHSKSSTQIGVGISRPYFFSSFLPKCIVGLQRNRDKLGLRRRRATHHPMSGPPKHSVRIWERTHFFLPAYPCSRPRLSQTMQYNPGRQPLHAEGQAYPVTGLTWQRVPVPSVRDPRRA